MENGLSGLDKHLRSWTICDAGETTEKRNRAPLGFSMPATDLSFCVARLRTGSAGVTNCSAGRAAGAGRDRVAVGAGGGMAEEGADALIEFRRNDVFELAGMGISFGFGEIEGVGE